MWKQLIDANMSTGYEGGWCLKFVQDAFGTDHPYPSAMDAWNANYGNGNHPNELPPSGKTVPVYFALGNVPAGHVAVSLDDGMVASSTQGGVHSTPYFHQNLDNIIWVYGRYNGGCTYLGWSEFVGTQRVVEFESTGATREQVIADYIEILERDPSGIDEGGIQTYTTNGMTNDQVREDLLASDERKVVVARYEAAQQVTTFDEPITTYIPYDTTTVDLPNEEKGVQITQQMGVDGTRTVTTRITKTGGVETSREVISDVTVPPVTLIKGIGSKTAEPTPVIEPEPPVDQEPIPEPTTQNEPSSTEVVKTTWARFWDRVIELLNKLFEKRK